jgi:ribosome modulation factor
VPEPRESPDVYSEGMDARAKGKPVKVCPYPKGSDDRETWIEGWHEADALDEESPAEE